MNVEIINPFLDATVNVLSTMAMTEAKPGSPAVKDSEVAKGDVSGLLAMTTGPQKVSIAITFPSEVILPITKQMLGDDLSEIDETVTDLVGELTNMIVGGAKKDLGERGLKFNMAIPTVVAGKGHSIYHKAKGLKIVVPFTTSYGDFFIEICYEESDGENLYLYY